MDNVDGNYLFIFTATIVVRVVYTIVGENHNECNRYNVKIADI